MVIPPSPGDLKAWLKLPSEPPGKPQEETATLNGRDATMTKGVQAETEQHLLGM